MPQTSQLLRSRATHRYTLPADELGLEVPTSVAPERADVIEIHDVRAVNAHETLCIESLFKSS